MNVSLTGDKDKVPVLQTYYTRIKFIFPSFLYFFYWVEERKPVRLFPDLFLHLRDNT